MDSFYFTGNNDISSRDWYGFMAWHGPTNDTPMNITANGRSVIANALCQLNDKYNDMPEIEVHVDP